MTNDAYSDKSTQTNKKGKHWEDCKLGREKQAENVKKFIENKYEVLNKRNHSESVHTPPAINYTLNICASWGAGKTHFIQRLRKDFDEDNYVTVYFDAWRYDQTKNALASLLQVLYIQLEQKTNEIKQKKDCSEDDLSFWRKHLLRFKGSGSKIAGTSTTLAWFALTADPISSTALGNTVSAAVDYTSEKIDNDKDGTKKEINCTPKEAIQELIDASHWEKFFRRPIIFFIDELDRCRPDFSIEVIESIKHVLDINHIVFVLSTDLPQLSASIENIYGEKYKGEEYLRKVINRNIDLLPSSKNDFCKHLFSNSDLDLYNPNYISPIEVNPDAKMSALEAWFTCFAESYQCEPRDCERAYDLVDTILTIRKDQISHLPIVFALIFRWIKEPYNFPILRNAKNTIERPNKVELHHLFQGLGLSNERPTLDTIIGSYDQFVGRPITDIRLPKNQSSYAERITHLIYAKVWNIHKGDTAKIGIKIDDLISQIRTCS